MTQTKPSEPFKLNLYHYWGYIDDGQLRKGWTRLHPDEKHRVNQIISKLLYDEREPNFDAITLVLANQESDPVLSDGEHAELFAAFCRIAGLV